MKDLKHLLYFEDLLQNANNELIEQAKSEGKICAAFTCENLPEPLMNLGNAFSVRLFAPNSGSLDIATYYMTNLLCETSRALLERAIEGGFNFADCLIAADGCTMMNRAAENMYLLHTMDEGKKNFFYEFMEIPLKADENGVDHFKLHQLSSRDIAETVLTRLKCSNKTLKRVTSLVLEHDNRIFPKRRTVKRFLAKYDYDFYVDWLKVRRADTLAQSDYMREEKLAELELLAKLGDEIKEEMCCLKTADLAINGHDMIAMGFSGADIKNALNTALEAVIDEEIENERETLLTFIRGKFYGQ